MDAFLNALADEPFRMGVTFAVLFTALSLSGVYLANKRWKWWVSTDILEVERDRAREARSDAAESITRAHADADAKVVSMREAMDKRIQEHREDSRDRATQIRADSQAELDRLLKIVDAVQREVESWRQAFHLADQANREEDDARWNRIEVALTVLQQFVTGIQRQLNIPPAPELEARGDGRGTADVV